MKECTRMPLPGMSLLVAASAWLMLVAHAQAASFDCAKARTAVEKSICADPGLSALDEHLGRYYAAARVALAHDTSCLVADQRHWLRNVRNACKGAECLTRATLQRLAVLDALQPGATRVRGITLPNERPLVWIIPPASDEVAAPRDVATKPLVVRGTLRDEVADGDGFVMQVANGARHVLYPLMLLESPSTEHLAILAATDGATYEARGRRQVTEDGSRDFAQGSCTYVYRATP